MASTADRTDPKAALKTAQEHLYEGRLEAAEATLEAVLAHEPGHLDVLYMKAVCKRFAKDHPGAFAVLQTLKEANPDFGRAWQEEGHLYRDSGDPEAALRAYRQACRLNPALAASWKAQADLLAARGQPAAARQAQAQADRLAALPKELAAVSTYLHEGKYLKAETLCRAFLKRNKTHVEGMRLLAEIGVKLGVLDDAEFLLESAKAFAPDNIQVRLDYIQTLRKRQKFEAALAEAKALYERDPDNPLFASHYAVEALQVGDFETALTQFGRVLTKIPNDPATLTSRGHALKTYGRTDEAVASYRAAYTAKPDHGDAYYALANLKTYRFDDAELEAMRRQEADRDTAPADRIHLSFALGKAYEDRGEYETAFGFYQRGNALKQRQSRYTAEQMDEELASQAAACTPALFETQGGKGHDAPDPIFIVGLPRAGSTLLEQILASHFQVDGTLELPNILSMAHKLRGRGARRETSRYPDILAELSAEQLQELGRQYIDETRVHRKGAPFFTDKMPNNFRHIGLIHLILPNAKIVDARRHPMACCFSSFKQLFAEGQEFTYGLEEIGRYYCGYVDLMAHFERVLPGKILRVHYEDVVADLEGQVRRLLAYCGLPFEEGCVQFHKTEREVRTASSEQVRRPIYKEGLEQWQHFEPWLGPLKDALGPALQDYR